MIQPFNQPPPTLPNQYPGDRVLRSYGVMATAYEGRYGAFARPYQFALAYLLHPSTPHPRAAARRFALSAIDLIAGSEPDLHDSALLLE